MEEIRLAFLDETVCSLQDLQKELPTFDDSLSEAFLRKFFRRLHTIKGSAQTLGAGNLARFAHQVETLLQGISTGRVSQNTETIAAVTESLTHLLNFCGDDDYLAPESFFAKLRRLTIEDYKFTLAGKIPEVLLAALTAPEIERLRAAISNRKFFYLLNASFNVTEFNNHFLNLREILGRSGEIVAVSPGNTTAIGEIAFRFFYVTSSKVSEVSEIIKSFDSTINFTTATSVTGSADSLDDLLARLTADGEKKAQILNKEIISRF